MGRATGPASLPVISVEPFLSLGNPERLSAAAALHNACTDYGFFYLDISSYVDPSEPEELTRLAHAFFALPQDEKEKISISNEDGVRGYQRLKDNVTNGKADNHEAIDFFRPVANPDKTKTVWGENQWPSIPSFKEKYDIWIEKMKKLGLIVMEAMAIGLGMTPEEWARLRSQIDDSFWVMRIIGYPPLPNDFDGFSCGAHKDYGCLTFLYADPTPGALQVFLNQPSLVDGDSTTNDGGRWISADPIPGCVVCNIGEMWEVWTNGLYKSTLHRVLHRGSNYRVSIPFFFEANFDALVVPLSAARRIQEADRASRELKEPLKMYEPIVYGDFLLKKLAGNYATSGQGRYAD
ncbi:hypothetical protein GSI_15248 [Ganoderma sinense ZZ0214-1]|uniref:Fe2OG dioxygenase domain-containing protein n=1 Tax=Ganoderma sinense ZZ0214-1 TaxID=1077348 RepID=A0A2G8RM18_9APHY|nr:hypothetical protein GSI_15248 [Ganoderma sinense ZZ0214-1]